MPLRRLAGFVALLVAGPARAQAPPAWQFAASAYLYPDAGPAFVLPIVTADRGALHLEARWNYEDLETASGWVGWTVSTHGPVTLAVTPMLGGVVGRSDGVAPGLELTLAWRRLELYVEAEHLFSLDDASEDYSYTWSQLTWSPVDALGIGLSVQRLRSVGTERTVDRGPMATFSTGPLTLEAYAFNPFDDDAFWILGASVAF